VVERADRKEQKMDFVIEEQKAEYAPNERGIVPAGVHSMTIKHCEEGPNRYKQCDENPTGDCIKLRLATVQGDYKFVFDDIPKHLGWRAKQLADAVGIVPVSGRLSLTPDELAGQVLTVEVSHYTSKAGKVSAVVKRYVPAAAGTTPPVKAKPRTVAARIPTSSSSDIPF
jgi:hypothetical protein